MTEERRRYQREYMRKRRAGASSVVEPVDVKYDSLNWHPIRSCPYYEVSDDGQIKSVKRIKIRSNGRRHTTPERVLKQNRDTHGYYHVHPYNLDGKRTTKAVHKLVWEAFNGPTDLDVHHKDHNPLNNRLDNLEALTRKEHQQRYVDDLEQKNYTRGYKEGEKEGYTRGWDDGHEAGYNEGYEAGTGMN